MKRILLIWTILATCLTMMAGNVTEQEALNIARQFLQGKLLQQQKQLRRAASAGDTPFYVFNVEQQGGFVIVSADDRTVPILGYADNGNLEMDKLPENARYWLESYAAQIKALGSNVKTTQAPRRVIGSPVTPLLTCQWDQRDPYNRQCPKSGDDYCVTGCVATAMAQVMYYYRYPNMTSTAIPGYKTEKMKLNLSELPATTFKWDKMKDTYSDGETGETADAVAELMRYCGQAVQMDYTTDESGASVYASHLTYYFGYSKTTRDVARANYTAATWEKLIYDEISASRPVLYSGQSGAGGHQFVVDGYDANGLFHINWGWSGQSDGFFTLSVLNPNDRGTGGGASTNGYTMDQMAIIGLKPDQGEQQVGNMVYCRSSYNTANYTRSTSTDNFTDVSVGRELFQFGTEEVTIDHAWMLYKDGQQLQTLYTQQNVTVATGGYYTRVTAPLNFGAGLADGQYELRQMSSVPGANQWEPCYDYFRTLLIAEISGNTLTLKPASEVTGTVQVNSATLTGKKMVNRPMTITLNWTNKGFYNETPFYLWLANATKSVGAAASFVERGATGDVEISFLPETAGTTTLYVTTDADGTQRVYETELTIGEPLAQQLSATIAFEGEYDHNIESTTINATITFTNEGTNEYDDDVLISLYKDNNPMDAGAIEITKSLQLAPGEQKSINLQFPDLTAKSMYVMWVHFYAPELSLAGYNYCTVGQSMAAVTLNVSSELSNISSTDVSGIKTIEGTTAKMNITLANTSTYDFDNRVMVYVYKTDADYNMSFVKEQSFDAKVAAGQTTAINDYEISGLEIGKMYLAQIFYFKAGDYEWGCGTPIFKMVTPTGIQTVTSDLSSDSPAYNLNGQRVTSDHKGLIIRNGKKYVRK